MKLAKYFLVSPLVVFVLFANQEDSLILDDQSQTEEAFIAETVNEESYNMHSDHEERIANLENELRSLNEKQIAMAEQTVQPAVQDECCEPWHHGGIFSLDFIYWKGEITGSLMLSSPLELGLAE